MTTKSKIVIGLCVGVLASIGLGLYLMSTNTTAKQEVKDLTVKTPSSTKTTTSTDESEDSSSTDDSTDATTVASNKEVPKDEQEELRNKSSNLMLENTAPDYKASEDELKYGGSEPKTDDEYKTAIEDHSTVIANSKFGEADSNTISTKLKTLIGSLPKVTTTASSDPALYEFDKILTNETENYAGLMTIRSTIQYNNVEVSDVIVTKTESQDKYAFEAMITLDGQQLAYITGTYRDSVGKLSIPYGMLLKQGQILQNKFLYDHRQYQ